jgi:photosystem II stability/assembly factor-like uncharacterized protein
MMNICKYGVISQSNNISNIIYLTLTDYNMSEVYRSTNAGDNIFQTGVEQIFQPVGIAMSSSGQYQTISAYSAGIFNSSDYGASWSQVTSSAYQWQMVAMSSNGQYQLASDSSYTGTLWLSSNYGITWNVTGSTKNNGNWYGVCMSDSGQYMFASGYGTSIYYSSNYGATWNYTNIDSYVNHWRYISMNSTGQYGITCDWNFYNLNLYKTSNYGATWSVISSLGTNNWNCSAGGGSYFIVCSDSSCYRSTNNGSTWAAIPDIVGGKTASISRSGATQTIIDYNSNHTWRSLDYGATWVNLGLLSYSTENIAISDLII